MVSNAVHAQAVVTAGEDAGLDAATLRTVRSLTEIALRAHGVAVVQDATDAKRFSRIHLIGADVIIPAYDPRPNNRFADAKRVYPALVVRLGF